VSISFKSEKKKKNRRIFIFVKKKEKKREKDPAIASTYDYRNKRVKKPSLAQYRHISNAFPKKLNSKTFFSPKISKTYPET
jgi:hypothetical protein